MSAKEPSRSPVERARAAAEFLKNNLSPQLRISQLDLLLSIYEQEGQIMSELAIDTGLTMSGVSRCYDNLSATGRSDGAGEPMGLLRNEPGKDDRIKRIYLTGKGKAVVDTYLALLQDE